MLYFMPVMLRLLQSFVMEKLEKTKRNYELFVRDFFQVKHFKEFNCIIAMVNGDGTKIKMAFGLKCLKNVID